LVLVRGSSFIWYQVLEFCCNCPTLPFQTHCRRISLSEIALTTSCHLNFLFHHHRIIQHYHPLIICDKMSIQLFHKMVDELWFFSTIGCFDRSICCPFSAKDYSDSKQFQLINSLIKERMDVWCIFTCCLA